MKSYKDFRNPIILKNLYIKQGYNVRQIASCFNVYPQLVRFWIHKHKIPLRDDKDRFKVTKEELIEFYCKKKLSQRSVAKKFGVSQKTIKNRMKRFGISSRCFTRSDITKKLLEELYYKKKFSMPKIAKILNTTYDTIWHKVRKYDIKVRSMSEAKMKYPKLPFSENLKEKAYMLGLRTGDISANKACKQITVVTATTHQAQLKMFRKIFEKYSFVNYFVVQLKDGRKVWQIYCRLDPSFSFILKKPNKIPGWIFENNKLFFAFLAGYADCEACWNIWKLKDCKKGRVRFQIISGDKIILRQIKNKLENLGYKPTLRLAHKKGYRKTFGKYNLDMYCLNLHYQKEVIMLVRCLLKLSNHEEKIRKMKLILENRGKNWEEIKDQLFEFKKWVNSTHIQNILYNNSARPCVPR